MQVCSDWTTEPWLTANFVFVARQGTGSAAIPALQPQTDAEHRLFAECEARNALKSAARNRDKELVAKGNLSMLSWPSAEAVNLAKALLQEARPLLDLPALAAGDSVLLSHTQLSNVFICQPQHRNTHHRVFGGFLMRRAFELAFATAYQFAGAQPVFREVDEVTFQRPVDVGDLVRFESVVVGTHQPTPPHPHPQAQAQPTKHDPPRVYVEVRC